MSGNNRLRLNWYLVAVSSTALVSPPIHAQSNIVPDNTLGSEASIVTTEQGELPSELITGGALRGQNLFHSFQEFNVAEGRGAYFVIADPNIANILSRVTGNNISEIFGTLGTSGASQPNLFLINPNGIIFGENASLDVGASFTATTADRIQFGEEGFFSASEPETPPLLTVQPSAFLFNQVNPGGIQNNSFASAGTDPTGNASFFGLRVPDGESMSFIAGDVAVNSGGMVALDGQINLAAVKSGTIAFEGDNFSLADNAERGNISLTNGAGLLAAGSSGGKIAIAADNINLSDNSTVITGILSNLGSTEAQAEDIELNSTGNIAIDNSSVYNRINNNAVGNSGDLSIDTTDLTVTNGGQIGVFTFGTGNTGEVNINADRLISLNGENSESLTGIFAQIVESGIGNAGNLNIAAESISLANGSLLDTRTFGTGNAGDIAIAASDSLVLDGSSIFTAATGNSIGNAGSINLSVGSFSIINGGAISSSSFSQGNAGNVDVDVSDSSFLLDSGSIFTSVEENAVGDAGNLSITASSIALTNDALLDTRTRGRGNAGNIALAASNSIMLDSSSIFSSATGDSIGNAGSIDLDVDSLLITNGGTISSSSFGQGNANSIDIDARESIDLRGVSADGQSRSGIFVQTAGEGQAENLTLDTKKLIVRDGAIITAGVSETGTGRGGNLTVDASESIELVGVSADGQSRSAISVETGGEGQAGELTLNTGELFILDGAIVTAGVRETGTGSGGNLTINASDSIELAGVSADGQSRSAISVETGGAGQAGDLVLNTQRLTIQSGGIISAGVRETGTGRGGNLTIDASEYIELVGVSADGQSRSAISVETGGEGQAGELTLNTGELFILDGAIVTAGVRETGTGSGGNLTVNASDSIELAGVSADGQSRSAISVETGGAGQAGDLVLNTQRLTIQSGAIVSANTRQGSTGRGGNLFVNASEFALLDNSGLLQSRSRGSGVAGNLTVITDNLTLNDNSLLSADTSNTDGGNINLSVTDSITLDNNSNITATAGTAEAGGDGGNIDIDTEFIVAYPNGSNDITANAFEGAGGNIEISAESLFGIESRPSTPPNSTNDIDASSQFGLDGEISIETPDVDPARGLDNLPTNVVDASQLITRNCLSGGEQQLNEFVITGRGGLPTNPSQALSGKAIPSAEWVSLPEMKIAEKSVPDDVIVSVSNDRIIEAQGWRVKPDGTIVLVAEGNTSSVAVPPLDSYSCDD